MEVTELILRLRDGEDSAPKNKGKCAFLVFDDEPKLKHASSVRAFCNFLYDVTDFYFFVTGGERACFLVYIKPELVSQEDIFTIRSRLTYEEISFEMARLEINTFNFYGTVYKGRLM